MTKKEIINLLERRIEDLEINVDFFGDKANKDYEGYFSIYYAECEKLKELKYLLFLVKGAK